MDALEITGGTALRGTVKVSGAKNAALPLLAVSLMGADKLTLENLPALADTNSMIELLEHHGLIVARHGETVSFSGSATNFDAPYELVAKMRASILVLGPLLARYGEARVSLPGGCAIGTRPVDLHVKAMQKLGATVELADGYIQARAPKGLTGARIVFPFVSVGATENAMMAAALAQGTTELVQAAREPEIIDLATCLNAMGAKITGHGTDIITIEGVDALHSTNHQVLPDRIEAGSFAIGAAMTCGHLRLETIVPAHLESLFDVMRDAGASITTGTDWAEISASHRLQAVDIETRPYPGFATDLQAQYMAMMCLADGSSVISETIFENRFMHVPELARMGANIIVDGRSAVVKGREALKPAPVMATDLRASISLVLAALTIDGVSRVNRIYHLDRGYSRLEEKLGACGAKLQRVQT